MAKEKNKHRKNTDHHKVIDVTHGGSRHKEFINGVKNGGEVTIDMDIAQITGILEIDGIRIPVTDEEIEKISEDITIPLSNLSKKGLLGLVTILLNRISNLEGNNGEAD